MSEHVCPKCGASDPSEFGSDAAKSDGLSTVCLRCRREYDRERRTGQSLYEINERRQQQRVMHLMRKHGMTMSQFQDLLQQQDEKCGICKGILVDPEIDHDHVTMAIRGILCGNCNRGLGLFRDSPEILEAAAKYLRIERKPPDLASLLMRLHYK